MTILFKMMTLHSNRIIMGFGARKDARGRRAPHFGIAEAELVIVS